MPVTSRPPVTLTARLPARFFVSGFVAAAAAVYLSGTVPLFLIVRVPAMELPGTIVVRFSAV